MNPPLTLIAAVARNGAMGLGGTLPWELPEDRAHFHRRTMGHAVIMGRRTWDETGKPLEGRRNIVVSRSGQVSGVGREVVGTLDEAIALARTTDPEPFVIGGAQIFALALPLATRMILSEVDLDVEGDTFFPAFDRRAWHVVERQPGDRATYVIYERDGSKLQELAAGLRELHQGLLEEQRAEYERSNGPIAGGAQLLHLVAHDSSFAWLRVLSTLMVDLDVLLDETEPPSDVETGALRQELEETFSPAAPEQFWDKCLPRLQVPRVAMAYGRVRDPGQVAQGSCWRPRCGVAREAQVGRRPANAGLAVTSRRQ